MTRPRFDVLVIGAGVVGLATARALARRFACSIAVLEAEPAIATHQTGRNSGVIHSGLYYPPGSLKARNCVLGRRQLVEFCERHDVPFELCGKLVIATTTNELPRLDELERRGRANGLKGLERVGAERIADFEPAARGESALWVPETGIVGYVDVARALLQRIQELGVELHLGTRVRAIRAEPEAVVVDVGAQRISGRFLINCAGLQCDRVARLAGVRPEVRIVPFRGDYLTVDSSRREILRNLIYPVPDPRFPFLGVHLTRRIDGGIEAGPNAALALDRHGYDRRAPALRDTWDTVTWPGFWRLAARYWRVGGRELLRAGSPKRFARELQRFVPSISATDLAPGGCGIRAQALDRAGNLVDDFVIAESPRALHVLNAPSPAATSSLAIGDELARRAEGAFGLEVDAD